MLHEIGRLRELRFRASGEGTGKEIDIDRFDFHYRHLFLWNHEKSEVAGAYRLAATSEVLQTRGASGLYTSTLFDIPTAWWREVGDGLELGRSFVRAEYQRAYQPLLMLWKGISAWIARNPSHTRLFGPVSISQRYSRAARDLIVAYFDKGRDETCGIRPWHPYRPAAIGGAEFRELAATIESVEELADVIADLEPDQAGLPVLLRQYSSLGGRILGFNVDPLFSNSLDGFVLVDLASVDERSPAAIWPAKLP